MKTGVKVGAFGSVTSFVLNELFPFGRPPVGVVHPDMSVRFEDH